MLLCAYMHIYQMQGLRVDWKTFSFLEDCWPLMLLSGLSHQTFLYGLVMVVLCSQSLNFGMRKTACEMALSSCFWDFELGQEIVCVHVCVHTNILLKIDNMKFTFKNFWCTVQYYVHALLCSISRTFLSCMIEILYPLNSKFHFPFP